MNWSLFQEKNQWHTGLAQDLCRLRRPVDKFIYEPVFVVTYEDAVLATILNGNVEAEIICEGIPLASSHDAPVLREFLATKSTVVISTAGGALIAGLVFGWREVA